MTDSTTEVMDTTTEPLLKVEALKKHFPVSKSLFRSATDYVHRVGRAGRGPSQHSESFYLRSFECVGDHSSHGCGGTIQGAKLCLRK